MPFCGGSPENRIGGKAVDELDLSTKTLPVPIRSGWKERDCVYPKPSDKGRAASRAHGGRKSVLAQWEESGKRGQHHPDLAL